MIKKDLNVHKFHPVINVTGTDISKLSCVIFSGISGDHRTVVLAGAADIVNGIVSDVIFDGRVGFIHLPGSSIENIDTSVFLPGTQLYCDASGQLTDTVTGDVIGVVVKSNIRDGIIQFNVVP